MKINMIRFPLNQCKITSRKQRLWKTIWLLKMLVVWGSKDQGKRTLRQNLHESKYVQNFTTSMQKNKSIKENLTINLDVENVGVLGSKTTMKENKQGGTFALKLMCPRIHKIHDKAQVTNRDFENQLGCWKCWCIGSENNKERGHIWGEICMKINVSKNPQNPWQSTSRRQRFFL